MIHRIWKQDLQNISKICKSSKPKLAVFYTVGNLFLTVTILKSSVVDHFVEVGNLSLLPGNQIFPFLYLALSCLQRELNIIALFFMEVYRSKNEDQNILIFYTAIYGMAHVASYE